MWLPHESFILGCITRTRRSVRPLLHLRRPYTLDGRSAGIIGCQVICSWDAPAGIHLLLFFFFIIILDSSFIIKLLNQRNKKTPRGYKCLPQLPTDKKRKKIINLSSSSVCNLRFVRYK